MVGFPNFPYSDRCRPPESREFRDGSVQGVEGRFEGWVGG